MKLHRLVFGLVVFSLFIVGSVFIVGNVNERYDTNMNTSDFDDTYDVIDDMYDISEGMKDDTIAAEVEGGEQTWEKMTKGPYEAVRLLKETFRLVGAIIHDLANTLDVPPQFFQFALVSLSFFVVFGVVYLVMRYKP